MRVVVDGAPGTLDGYPTPLGRDAARFVAFVVLDRSPWLLTRVLIAELELL